MGIGAHNELHVPVLLAEVLHFFSGVHLKTFFDATLGAGGHAHALLRAHPEIELYVGCDRDRDALHIAQERLARWEDRVRCVHADFAELGEVLERLGLKEVDGLLFDLGVSSMQLDRGELGFSFLKEGPLDMRMDRDAELTAKQIVNGWPEVRLQEIFRDLGEEPRWRRAAEAIVIYRRRKRIETTQELASLLLNALRTKTRGRLHPATLIFQALRMAVNHELESLQLGLQEAIAHLAPGGRLGVLSFHRLEDRLVKQTFKASPLTILTKKPIGPSRAEVRGNPRARSAKMRFAQREG